MTANSLDLDILTSRAALKLGAASGVMENVDTFAFAKAFVFPGATAFAAAAVRLDDLSVGDGGCSPAPAESFSFASGD
jgi:hypothetical protein